MTRRTEESSDPVRHVQTAKFRLEREMLPKLRTELLWTLNIVAYSGVRVVQEPALGPRIPDLLVGVWNDRPAALPARLTYVDAAILALFDKAEHLSLADVTAHLHLSSDAGGRHIARLAKFGLLEAVSENAYSLRHEFRSRSVEIIAVEVKLRRWREALAQAVDYLRFSDRAYVVLDAAQSTVREDVERAFAQTGVGLILQRGDDLQEVLPAIRRHATGPVRFLAMKKLGASPDV
jgi:hypothetical protein